MPSTTLETPCVLTIFGAGGDLTWRLVMPAVFNLFLEQRLPEKFAVLGLDRVAHTEDDFRQRLRDGVNQFSRRGQADHNNWEVFAKRVHYLEANFKDADFYKKLAETLGGFEKDWQSEAARIFYLAVPPRLFGIIPENLAGAGLAEPRERSRVVVEKPLGHDLNSAKELNSMLTSGFEESQIYRIDHYLGKDPVQNILAFRFANPLFEPIWNRNYLDHVAITVSETVGVEHRGEYYEKAGCLRDMVQNHLFQLLCLTAMEPPVNFEADEVRNKKVDVLHAVRPIDPDDVFNVAARGQYASGWIGGQKVPGYREEDSVAPDSVTETFAAVKMFVDNWRWQDVPFYLRTGKRMPRQAYEISLRFHSVPHQPFPPGAFSEEEPARLVFCIQPEEGIVLKFKAKRPGQDMFLQPVNMRFSYPEAFDVELPDAYETLLWDIMQGDQTLFMREDQIEAAWSILMPILDVWGSHPSTEFPNYNSGSWGPESAEMLIAQDGRTWYEPTQLGKAESKR